MNKRKELITSTKHISVEHMNETVFLGLLEEATDNVREQLMEDFIIICVI